MSATGEGSRRSRGEVDAQGYTNSSAAWSFNIVSSKKFDFRSVLYSGPRTWDAQGPTLFR